MNSEIIVRRFLVFLLGNKIDLDRKAVERKYNLSEKIKCPLFLVSASDGTNVVRVFCIF